jgi:hypothetical protein
MDDLHRRWRAFQAGERRQSPQVRQPADPRPFETWVDLDGCESLPPGWRLLDLETSALRGGFAFLGGVAAVRDGRLRIVQWLLGDLPGEEAFLRALARELDGADCLVTYNGRSFDWPLLRDRARLNGVAPWPEPPHRDLLHEARAVWGARLGRLGLVDLERALLGGQPRRGDPGGAAMPGLYRAHLAGEAAALDPLLRHNAADLVALAALAARCRALDMGDWRREEAPDLLGLAGWRWRRGDRHGAEAALTAWLDRAGRPSRADALRAATLCRRLARWDEAASLWARAAEGPFGSVDAAVALAIHLERRRRDPAAALEVVEAAMARPWVSPARRSLLLARRDRLRRRVALAN